MLVAAAADGSQYAVAIVSLLALPAQAPGRVTPVSPGRTHSKLADSWEINGKAERSNNP
jgi:hypothetical protein